MSLLEHEIRYEYLPASISSWKVGERINFQNDHIIDWIAHEKNAIIYFISFTDDASSKSKLFSCASLVCKKEYFIIATNNKFAIIEKNIETGLLTLFLTARLERGCKIAPKSKMKNHLNIDRG